MKEILMFSGMDSLIAWYYLNKPPVMYCDLRHSYAMKERLMVEETAAKLGMDLTIDRTFDLSLAEQPNYEIPMRNAYLAMAGSMKANNIWMVFQKGETENPSNDRSPEFCEKLSALLSHLHGTPIRVDSPFWHMTKSQMVRWYLDKHYRWDTLFDVAGCFDPNPGHCGECSACFRKFVACEFNGLNTLKQFRTNPAQSPIAQTYYRRALSGHYDESRAAEILTVLKKHGWEIESTS